MAKSKKSSWSTLKKQYTSSQNQWNKMTGFPTCKKKSFYEDYSITKAISSKTYKTKNVKSINVNSYKNWENNKSTPQNKGCYIATCVYGTYDCPQVWTLRRYRDNTLNETLVGRIFVRMYYFVSPILVKHFGSTVTFKKIWGYVLDKFVCRLNEKGVENTEYFD